MYTSRYNACDLNEMPEQLCEGVSWLPAKRKFQIKK